MVSQIKNTMIYPGSDPSYEGNSLTFSGMIFMKIGVIKGEQSARLIYV
jgi:hypothetical protein